jgi:hypothetical protein
MKTNWLTAALTAMALIFAVCNVTGCKRTEPQALQYTCPMHPEVVKNAPGDCPKCGMKLVEKH